MESKFDLWEECSFLRWDEELKKILPPINCGDDDLNDFFLNDAVLYSKELLGKTYVWVTNSLPNRIVAAFTVSNDSIKTKQIPRSTVNKLNRRIDNHKRSRSYPAVLIGRLGVDKTFQGGHRHIGVQVIEFLKLWFYSDDNKTGCRFLIVDAYNKEVILQFYNKCGFKFIYQTEEEEKEFFGLEEVEHLHTRMMYLDLK